MRYLIMALLIFMTACTSVTPINSANGSKRYLIECRRSASNCVEKANEICHKGYDIIGQIATTTVGRANITIQCKN